MGRCEHPRTSPTKLITNPDPCCSHCLSLDTHYYLLLLARRTHSRFPAENCYFPLAPALVEAEAEAEAAAPSHQPTRLQEEEDCQRWEVEVETSHDVLAVEDLYCSYLRRRWACLVGEGEVASGLDIEGEEAVAVVDAHSRRRSLRFLAVVDVAAMDEGVESAACLPGSSVAVAPPDAS